MKKKNKSPYHDHSKGVITKKIDSPELAPNLVVSVKRISENKYYIAIIHPNTKEILYEKNHLAKSFEAAFLLGKQIKEKQFSDVSTWAEEILFIPRPKRGKMKLKLKEDEDLDGEEID
jgi:hypothetical protein